MSRFIPKSICLIFGLICSAQAYAASVAEFAVAPDGKLREDLWPMITSVILNAQKGDVITLVDAKNSSRVGTIKITDEIAEAPNPTAKATWLTKQQGDQVNRMKAFLKSPSEPNASADFARYVRSLELRKSEFSGYPVQAVFVGSPLSTQPDVYNMRGRYLSDAFLINPDTPFSTGGKQTAIRGVTFHVLHSAAATEFSDKNRDLHYNKTRRFIGLYVGGLGGSLATFSGDVSHLKSLLKTQFNRTDYGTPEMGDGKLRIFEVLEPRLQREDENRQSKLWQDRLDKNPSPPSSSKSPLDIGLNWDKNVDVDLFVQADGDSEIFYGRQTSERYGARFLKDITNLPDSKGFETVTFSKDTPIRNLKVFINHYSGTSSQPIGGELRIRFDNKIYFKTFQLPPGNGTQGRGDRMNHPAWIKVDISSIVGL
jgi:hypothetical protein